MTIGGKSLIFRTKLLKDICTGVAPAKFKLPILIVLPPIQLRSPKSPQSTFVLPLVPVLNF